LLFGQTGLLSFGHAVYFGLGGYAAVHLMRAINQGLPLPMPFVPLAGAAAGPAVRPRARRAHDATRRHHLRADLARRRRARSTRRPSCCPASSAARRASPRAGRRPRSLLGLDLGSQLQVYYLVAVWALASAVAMRGVRAHARRAHVQRGARQSRARRFVGYDPRRVRFIACAVAGLFAGVAGGLQAINYEIVAADAVAAQRSGTVLIMAYLGGTGHFAGPVLGAVVLTWLQTSLSAYTSAWQLYVGSSSSS
jgi:branched-chain amino acid transport system permease protein